MDSCQSHLADIVSIQSDRPLCQLHLAGLHLLPRSLAGRLQARQVRTVQRRSDKAILLGLALPLSGKIAEAVGNSYSKGLMVVGTEDIPGSAIPCIAARRGNWEDFAASDMPRW